MEQHIPEAKGFEHKFWVNWEQEIVSFHEAEGFDPLLFVSLESWQANIRVLLTLGFRFQSFF